MSFPPYKNGGTTTPIWTLLAYNFRIVTTFLVSTAVLVVAPTTSGISVTGGKNLGFLILVTLSFGILHQISYESFTVHLSSRPTGNV